MKIKEQVHVTLTKEPLSYHRIRDILNVIWNWVSNGGLKLFMSEYVYYGIYTIFNIIHHNIAAINLKSDVEIVGGGGDSLFLSSRFKAVYSKCNIYN